MFLGDRLYRLALNVTTEVLEAVGTSLSLLEELNRAQRSRYQQFAVITGHHVN